MSLCCALLLYRRNQCWKSGQVWRKTLETPSAPSMPHTITQIVSVEPPCADFQAPLEYRGLQVNSLYPETFRTCTRSIANIGHARGHPSGAFKTTHIEIEPRRQKRTNRADRVGRRDRIHKYFPKGKSYNEKKDRPGMEMFLRWLQVALVRRASVAGDSGQNSQFADCMQILNS